MVRTLIPEAEMPQRFLQLADVAEILNISANQAYQLVNTKELRAIKVGGRGQWRIEASELEAYIQRKYVETEELLDSRSVDETADPDA
jgi:excisionase family DNA binding protein